MRRWILILFCILLMMIGGCSNNQAVNERKAESTHSVKASQQKAKKPLSLPKLKSIRYGPDHPDYKMNVHYDPDKHVINGSMTVQFTNNLDRPLHHVYFNLWPNAPAFKEGGIQVSNVKWNGQPAKFQVNKTKLDLSQLDFGKGKKATVTMSFTEKLPKTQDRFGWYGKTSSFGNWFPIIAVYDDEGWNLDPYFARGESFYSLTGNFDVTLTTDSKEVVAATGQTVGVKKSKGESTYHFQAQNVRDFAMEMNPAYHVKSTKVDGIQLNLYYTDDEKIYADDFIRVGKESLQNYNKTYGRYPWKELDITGMKGWFGGMEYPQLVMISFQDNYSSDFLRLAVAHEIAHQWFYGAIGDNEYDSPWLDEAFATFASVKSFSNLRNLRPTPFPKQNYYHVTSPVSVFTSHGEKGVKKYNQVIYYCGANMLNDLRKKVGDKVFFRAMRQYYKNEKFKVATTADFKRVMEKTSGQDLTEFFKKHRVYINEKE